MPTMTMAATVSASVRLIMMPMRMVRSVHSASYYDCGNRPLGDTYYD